MFTKHAVFLFDPDAAKMVQTVNNGSFTSHKKLKNFLTCLLLFSPFIFKVPKHAPLYSDKVIYPD